MLLKSANAPFGRVCDPGAVAQERARAGGCISMCGVGEEGPRRDLQLSQTGARALTLFAQLKHPSNG
jgi:hypothetical protein